MDKELLARRLYSDRVSALMGDEPVDEAILYEMWKNRASPEEAARAMQADNHGFEAAPWLQRYLNRK